MGDARNGASAPERCATCWYWLEDVCRRYPTYVSREADEWCGEWVSRQGTKPYALIGALLDAIETALCDGCRDDVALKIAEMIVDDFKAKQRPDG